MAGESLAAINISAGGLIGTFNISFSLSGSAARSFYVPEDFPFEVLALGFVTLDIPVLTAGDNKEVQLILTEPVPEGRELELVIQGAESSEVELLFHLGEDSTDSRSPCNSADANCSAFPISHVHPVRPPPAPIPGLPATLLTQTAAQVHSRKSILCDLRQHHLPRPPHAPFPNSRVIRTRFLYSIA